MGCEIFLVFIECLFVIVVVFVVIIIVVVIVVIVVMLFVCCCFKFWSMFKRRKVKRNIS